MHRVDATSTNTVMVYVSPGEKFQVPEAREDGSSEGAVDHGVRLHARWQHQGQRVVERVKGGAGMQRDDNRAQTKQGFSSFPGFCHLI